MGASLPRTTEAFWRTMVQTLYPAMYQHDNAPIHKSRLVTEWFDEHESEVEYFEPLWGYFGGLYFSPPASHGHLNQEEWLKIPLATVNLPFPR